MPLSLADSDCESNDSLCTYNSEIHGPLSDISATVVAQMANTQTQNECLTDMMQCMQVGWMAVPVFAWNPPAVAGSTTQADFLAAPSGSPVALTPGEDYSPQVGNDSSEVAEMETTFEQLRIDTDAVIEDADGDPSAAAEPTVLTPISVHSSASEDRTPTPPSSEVSEFMPAPTLERDSTQTKHGPKSFAANEQEWMLGENGRKVMVVDKHGKGRDRKDFGGFGVAAMHWAGDKCIGNTDVADNIVADLAMHPAQVLLITECTPKWANVLGHLPFGQVRPTDFVPDFHSWSRNRQFFSAVAEEEKYEKSGVHYDPSKVGNAQYKTVAPYWLSTSPPEPKAFTAVAVRSTKAKCVGTLLSEKLLHLVGISKPQAFASEDALNTAVAVEGSKANLCYTRWNIAEVQWRHEEIGRQQHRFMCVHLHHTVAKKEPKYVQAFKGCMDSLASRLRRYNVDIFGGTFNAAVWAIVDEMRSRGIELVMIACPKPYRAKSIDEEALRVARRQRGVASMDLNRLGDPRLRFETMAVFACVPLARVERVIRVDFVCDYKVDGLPDCHPTAAAVSSHRYPPAVAGSHLPLDSIDDCVGTWNAARESLQSRSYAFPPTVTACGTPSFKGGADGLPFHLSKMADGEHDPEHYPPVAKEKNLTPINSIPRNTSAVAEHKCQSWLLWRGCKALTELKSATCNVTSQQKRVAGKKVVRRGYAIKEIGTWLLTFQCLQTCLRN